MSAAAKPAAHTPGPWECDENGYIRDSVGRAIAIAGMVANDADENVSNGLLIAAAPETTERLLARYRACHDFNCYGSKDCPYCEGDRAVLQKAGVL